MAANVYLFLRRAYAILQDADAIRWPIPELVDWMQDGLDAIAVVKPEAFSTRRHYTLRSGTLQAVPDSDYRVLRFECNVDGADLPTSTIRMSSAQLLDAYVTGWADSDVVPAARKVANVVSDPDQPREFRVWPPNDGTGRIRVLASARPDLIDISTDTTLAETQDIEIPIAPEMHNALLDYTLHKAFAKDMDVPNAAARSNGHYQAFAAKLGLLDEIETAQNANTPTPKPTS